MSRLCHVIRFILDYKKSIVSNFSYFLVQMLYDYEVFVSFQAICLLNTRNVSALFGVVLIVFVLFCLIVCAMID